LHKDADAVKENISESAWTGSAKSRAQMLSIRPYPHLSGYGEEAESAFAAIAEYTIAREPPVGGNIG